MLDPPHQRVQQAARRFGTLRGLWGRDCGQRLPCREATQAGRGGLLRVTSRRGSRWIRRLILGPGPRCGLRVDGGGGPSGILEGAGSRRGPGLTATKECRRSDHEQTHDVHRSDCTATHPVNSLGRARTRR